VTGHVARGLGSTRRVVVVAMGRGGPPEPEVIVVRPTVGGLLELSRDGRHAASDHLETALVAGVPTVGARRCGGGLAGAVAVSNVREGVSVAAGLEPELVVLDGSGAALPPIDAGRRILVTSAAQPIDVAAGYLNAYRARIADLVVVTMAEPDAPHAELADALRKTTRSGVPLIRTVLRPRPIEPVDGARIAFFCTAPVAQHDRIAAHLAEAYGAVVRSVSGNLADRALLRADVENVDADVYLVELKAAAVDVVVEEADRRGIRVVVAANDVLPLPGESSLDAELERLAIEALTSQPEGVRW
jgi:cyclic 2,3-diphosphoglycerate synthetase